MDNLPITVFIDEWIIINVLFYKTSSEIEDLMELFELIYYQQVQAYISDKGLLNIHNIIKKYTKNELVSAKEKPSKDNFFDHIINNFDICNIGSKTYEEFSKKIDNIHEINYDSVPKLESLIKNDKIKIIISHDPDNFVKQLNEKHKENKVVVTNLNIFLDWYDELENSEISTIDIFNSLLLYKDRIQGNSLLIRPSSQIVSQDKYYEDEEVIVGDYVLESFEVYSSKYYSATAKITLRNKDFSKVVTKEAKGVGSIDAACKALDVAIESFISLPAYKIQLFEVENIDESLDSAASSTIIIKSQSKDGQEQYYKGHKSHKDTIQAALYSYAEAINNLYENRPISSNEIRKSVISITTQVKKGNKNFKEVNLCGKIIPNVKWNKINLEGANLSGTTIINSTINEANLNSSNFIDSIIRNSKFADSNFSFAKMQSTTFENTVLKKASFINADLTDANLTSADLTDADLTDADLTDADLTGANLTGANLTGADLTGADLTGADLTGADLEKAYLIGADLTSANLTSANLTGAELTGAELTGAELTGAELTGANISFTHLEDLKDSDNITLALNANQKRGALFEITDILCKFQINIRDISIDVREDMSNESYGRNCALDCDVPRNVDIKQVINQLETKKLGGQSLVLATEPITTQFEKNKYFAQQEKRKFNGSKKCNGLTSNHSNNKEAMILIVASDRIGLIKDISKVIRDEGLDVNKLVLATPQSFPEIDKTKMVIITNSMPEKQFNRIKGRLEKVDSVESACDPRAILGTNIEFDPIHD